MTETPLQSD